VFGSTGEPVNFTMWKTGEPGENGADCIVSTIDGLWADEPCLATDAAVVCEKVEQLPMSLPECKLS
jgi:hypothetical protein